MIKIIIVDDHELFRFGVRNIIESRASNICITGEAGSGDELFLLLPNVEADIILLDLLMPGMSGIETAKRLRNEYPDLKILVLSSESTTDMVQEVLEAGVDGFISKSAGHAAELPEAIRTIVYGDKYFGSDISTIIYNIFVAKKGTAEPTVEFTKQECKIILLCRDGLLCKEIADRLSISPRTVEAHKANIFQKLGINNTMEMVQYALKHKIIAL